MKSKTSFLRNDVDTCILFSIVSHKCTFHICFYRKTNMNVQPFLQLFPITRPSMHVGGKISL